jgi:YD repeat-containing protein
MFRSADAGAYQDVVEIMEQKSPRTRKAVKTVAPRLSSRERRCSQNGKLTAPVEGAIRLAEQAEAAAHKGVVEVVEAYFDANGRPIKRKGLGAARVARAYDAQGNQVEVAYFNTDGKPTVAEEVGAARIAWRYDDAGRRVETAFFGADGAPVPQPAGHKRAN